MMKTAIQIRVMRAVRGMSQQELARAAGVSRQTIATAELGQSRPSMETMVALRDALQWTPREDAALALFDNEED